MPWVEFTANYDFWIGQNRRACVAYRKGTVHNVTRECRDRATAAGKARPCGPPKRKGHVRRL